MTEMIQGAQTERLHRAVLGLGLLALVGVAGGADGAASTVLEMLARQAGQVGRQGLAVASAWYGRTPPMERVTWGGLVACAVLGGWTFLERSRRTRRSRVIPRAFAERFQRRLVAGQLDRGKALDYCEINPSPAARVALAAVHRWGRPTADLERAVSLARRCEVDDLRRHVGSLRRVAGLAPLIGLLGTLTTAARELSQLGPGVAWGPAVALALAPLTVSVGLAILALVFYDGLTGRVDALAGALDRIAAETVDAIALAAPAPAPTPAEARATRPDPAAAMSPPKPPHAIRIPVTNRVER
jgi:biopolymer transport protein ExbB